ncbi:MAG: hypothetical protein WAW79_12695, partial [Steroidobacteraceae bacterium]
MDAARVAHACAALSLISLGAMAGPAPPTEPGGRQESASGDAAIEAVLVTGQRRRQIFDQRLSTFVSAITTRSHTESLARWQVSICPWVAGAAQDLNEYIQGRVWQVAKYAGAPLAALDCSPNLVIVLTPEPELLLRGWWHENPRMFNWDRGIGGINRFIQSEETVRVWYNACPISPVWAKSFSNRKVPPCYTGTLGSKLTWESVRAIYSVIVVVDTGRIEGLTVGQLADFIAMISLVQV